MDLGRSQARELVALINRFPLCTFVQLLSSDASLNPAFNQDFKILSHPATAKE
jgi:hypothetical protein